MGGNMPAPMTKPIAMPKGINPNSKPAGNLASLADMAKVKAAMKSFDLTNPNSYLGNRTTSRVPLGAVKPQVMGGSSPRRPMPAPTAPTNNVGIGKFEQDQFNQPRAMGMLKTGGTVKASKRADGCAVRGKTKCKMVQP